MEKHPWTGEKLERGRILEFSRILMRKRTPRVGGLQAAAGRQHRGLLKGVAFIRSVTLGELLKHFVPWFPCL